MNSKNIKIQHGNLSINLPVSLRSFDFYASNPFVVFSKSEFMDPKNYLDFVNELDDFMEDIHLKTDHSGKQKLSFKARLGLHNKKFPLINSFIQLFNTKKFNNWFRLTHAPYYFPKRSIVVFPQSNFALQFYKLVDRFFHFINPMFNYLHILHTSIEFSEIPPGAGIPPHKDSLTKRLAFVFYVPKNNIDERLEKALGTNFWKRKDGKEIENESWHSEHKLSSDDQMLFEENYTKYCVVPYKSNSISGFIKSSNSWHSVDPNNSNQNRRAIVINVWSINTNRNNSIEMSLVKNKSTN